MNRVPLASVSRSGASGWDYFWEEKGTVKSVRWKRVVCRVFPRLRRDLALEWRESPTPESPRLGPRQALIHSEICPTRLFLGCAIWA